MIRVAEPLLQDDGPHEYRGRFDAEQTEAPSPWPSPIKGEGISEQGRWDDPTVGRWLTEDVVGFADDPSNLCR